MDSMFSDMKKMLNLSANGNLLDGEDEEDNENNRVWDF